MQYGISMGFIDVFCICVYLQGLKFLNGLAQEYSVLLLDIIFLTLTYISSNLYHS